MTIRRSPPCEAGKRTHGHPGDPWITRLRVTARARMDWARRKPSLLFRLSGVFLSRLAERTLLGLLFQEPPRITRWSPFGPVPAER